MVTPLCQQMQSNDASDFICVLPKGHAGEHDMIDAMGMCATHLDCRAIRPEWSKVFPHSAIDNPRPHTH
jgi:hypothetical protein